jgi:uncharacterized RDD family membrane protein YckC
MDNQPELNYLGEYAGFVSRLIAFAIDALIYIGIISTITLVANLVMDFLKVSQSLQSIIGYIILITNFLIYCLYFLGFWLLAGQTPGKALLGVRIVRTDGSRLYLRRAIIRLIGYWISVIFLFAGYWWVIFDPRRQAWHDKLAGTIVIYSWVPGLDRKYRPVLTLREKVKTARQQRAAKAQQNSGESPSTKNPAQPL